MKRSWLMIVLAMVASAAIAQDADSVRPIMTADDACKLAYAWTGFDKDRPVDLIPNCRAELVDSGKLQHPWIILQPRLSKIWQVTFDDVWLTGTDTVGNPKRSGDTKKCDLYFDPETRQLLLISLYTIGSDTSEAHAGHRELIEGCNGIPCASTPRLQLLEAMKRVPFVNMFNRRLVECRVTCCDSVPGPHSSVVWWICSRGEQVPVFGDLYGKGQVIESIGFCVDGNTGESVCGLRGF